MNGSYPDSPEAIALELWRQIREAEGDEPERGRNRPKRDDLIALYTACLAAVTRGEREALVSLH